jgi:hypothetical protein
MAITSAEIRANIEEFILSNNLQEALLFAQEKRGELRNHFIHLKDYET